MPPRKPSSNANLTKGIESIYKEVMQINDKLDVFLEDHEAVKVSIIHILKESSSLSGLENKLFSKKRGKKK